VICGGIAVGGGCHDRWGGRPRRAPRAPPPPRPGPRHVFAVSDVPYTLSGKKVEKAVKKLFAGEAVDNRDALSNPEVLDEYARLFDRG
jgi:acetoacetyl-CoA synthetase